MVTEEDFLAAERELVPSVSVKELEHYKRVRAQFEKPEEKQLENKSKIRAIENGRRVGEERPGSGKGKGKAVDRKGKGKAVGSWDENDDDEFYTGGGLTNGSARGDKGKGKVREGDVNTGMGFREPSLEDEEGLY